MKNNQHEHMKLRTKFTFFLLLVSTSLLVPKPALSAEKVLYERSYVVHTLGPVTSSLYFQRDFVKRQAAFIRRNPTTVPTNACNDIAPEEPTGIIKIVCNTVVGRVKRVLQAADANKCLKVRFLNGTIPSPAAITTAVTSDNSKYCK